MKTTHEKKAICGEKNKTKKHKKGQKTKDAFYRLPDTKAIRSFLLVFFPSRVESHTKKRKKTPQNNSNEKADKSTGGTVALEVEKERTSKESAGTGETLAAEQSTQNRPPDLCRKQKEEVVIMWLITMRMSDKSQYDFDMLVLKKKANSGFWFLQAGISLHYDVLSGDRNI